MGKKAWSIILLCVICISFVCEVGLLIDSGISLNEIASQDTPGNEIALMAILPMVYFGTVIIGGIIASVGFFCSLVNIKIAPNSVIKNISIVSVCVWSVIFPLLMGALVYIFL